MPVLAPGVAVRSRRPTLLVENDLALGSWLFRLTVVDDNGLESGPADLVIRVVARLGPIIDPGPLIPGPIIRPVGPGPIIDPLRIVTPERVGSPAPKRRPGGRRTRAPKADTPARPARPARRPRTRKKTEP